MVLRDSVRLGFDIGRELWLHRRPFLLYLKPTPRCDCRCLTCNRWEELDLDQLFKSQEFRDVADQLRNCNHCRLPCAVELAGNLPLALAGMFARTLD